MNEAPPTETIESIGSAFKVGEIDVNEVLKRLDAIGVRGAFDDYGKFLGYDYRNQNWVEI